MVWWWMQVCVVRGYDPVVGYLELEMAEEALSELLGMSRARQRSERFHELLLATQMMLKDWVSASNTALVLCEMNGSECIYFIHGAFCLHEVKETERAMELLISGPVGLRKDALFHYNLACYQAVLGAVDLAADSLCEAFRLDPELREVAAGDADLVGVSF